MKPAETDPRRLDVAAFAAQAGRLEGVWPAATMPRLVADAPVGVDRASTGDVHWRAEGQTRPVRGGDPELWLHLVADTEVLRECQRCLAPVALPIALDRWLRFVADEAQAAELDADSDDDVLALPRSLDLVELIEDELLLALPLVPTHEVCPEPLPMSAGPAEGEQAAEPAAHPFAALAALKGKAPKG